MAAAALAVARQLELAGRDWAHRVDARKRRPPARGARSSRSTAQRWTGTLPGNEIIIKAASAIVTYARAMGPMLAQHLELGTPPTA